jgi:ferritin-like metal-binding protein YciE
MKVTTLDEVLANELKDIYSAETQLIKALPRMARAAQSEDLRRAFEKHLEQTRVHVERIEEICSTLNIKPRGKKCVGMEGLIEEAKEVLEMDAHPEALQALLIGAAQRVEHYEIAAYGTARAHTLQLGYLKAVDLLNQTLEEEKRADELLTKLAENRINVKAAMNEDSKGTRVPG